MWRWNARIPFEENTYYHVYNRWFNKQLLFRNDQDYERFYKYVLQELKNFSSIKILSYCFLPNHFHLIIHNLETGLTVSDFMRKLQVSYAMYFKRNYETGLKTPVFEWRFKAKLIKDEKYLAQCIAYVNYNPLKHGIVDNIDNYKWTSYHQIDKKKIEKYSDMILDELEI